MRKKLADSRIQMNWGARNGGETQARGPGDGLQGARLRVQRRHESLAPDTAVLGTRDTVS